MSCMIQVTQMEIWVDFSLVPRRSLLIRCLREVWERVSLGEYLSVTSQLMVAENAWGLRLGGIVFQLESFSMEPHLIY